MTRHSIGLTNAEAQRKPVVQTGMSQIKIATSIQTLHQPLIYLISTLMSQADQVQRPAVPDMAASTCSQSFCSRHMRPISGTGSIALEEVVPTVAQTKQGTRPASRS